MWNKAVTKLSAKACDVAKKIHTDKKAMNYFKFVTRLYMWNQYAFCGNKQIER